MNEHELPPLPEPDTHCFDDDEQKSVWSYSADLVLAYARQAVDAEREACAVIADGFYYTTAVPDIGGAIRARGKS